MGIRFSLNFHNRVEIRNFAKVSWINVDNIKSCEKGKPFERMGRKATGLAVIGSGVARRKDTFVVETHSFFKRMGFFVGPHSKEII